MGNFQSQISSAQQQHVTAQKEKRIMDTIQELNITKMKIEHRIIEMSKQSTQFQITTKHYMISGEKQKALMSLKRKKLIDHNINKLNQASLTIDSQIFAIENMQMNSSITDALRQSVTVMKSISSPEIVDEVSETMDDINDHMNQINEIGQSLNMGFDSTNQLFDDETLEQELNNLILDQEEDDSITNLNNITIPNHPVQLHQQQQQQRLNDNNAPINTHALSFNSSSIPTSSAAQSIELFESFFG